MSEGQDRANNAEAWRNNADSVQRSSVSGRVNDRRYGEEVEPPEPSEPSEPEEGDADDNDGEDPPGYDEFGIPTGI